MLLRYTEDPKPGLTELSLLCNTEEAGLFSNVKAAVERGLSEIVNVDPPKKVAVICGSGPSLADTLESIREKKSQGATIFALNNAAKFLVENGIKPDYQVIVDPRPQNTTFLEKQWADTCLLASQCDSALFERCKELGYPVKLWHTGMQGIEKYLKKGSVPISSNLTVGLTAPSLVWTMGFRSMHLYGYDSSYREDKSHAFPQQMNALDEVVRACIDSKVFNCSLAMAGQVSAFRETYDMLVAHGTEIHVHGDGALPHLVRSWEREKTLKVLTAVYDLGVSPPTFDFLSFLIEAERHRRKENFDVIDVVFQPGPMYGFRDDNLPPDLPQRQRMLWNVCVSMAKLLPSVRNIEILQQRKSIEGSVFPDGYAESNPKAHYATAYLKNGEPILKASEGAKRKVPKYRYATITLRDSPYWPDRNSNLHEWMLVSEWLWRQDIQPIWIPDTEGQIPETFLVAREAATDLDLRAAYYEGAVINLGVLNGPMSLCAFLKCRYLICKVVVESAPASSTAFLKAHGFESGDGFGGNGKMIWKPDLAENIIPELSDLTKEKTS